MNILSCSPVQATSPFCGSIPKLWQVSSSPLQEQFAAMVYDEEGRAWERESDLRFVIRYARGSKKLQIPEGWRDLLPTAIWLVVAACTVSNLEGCIGPPVNSLRWQRSQVAAWYSHRVGFNPSAEQSACFWGKIVVAHGLGYKHCLTCSEVKVIEQCIYTYIYIAIVKQKQETQSEVTWLQEWESARVIL